MRAPFIWQLQPGGLIIAFVAAACLSNTAAAQDQATAPIEQVEVTATRITAADFNAPTPTTVVASSFIEQQAKDNLFDTIKELPSLLGSTGQQTGSNGTSGGGNGISSFNLFGLGTIRTLTLLDGQRVVPSNVTGVPDISLFPQLLIQRVDVVTGGASASWGSDAIAGVINFVTDKNFTGFKANISSGISTYGDNGSGTVQLAAGTGFAGGRGHIEVAGEFSHSDGVGINSTLGCCTNALPNGRTWFTEPTILEYGLSATPAGLPQYIYVNKGQHYQLGRYGLITNGPLQGTAFAGPNQSYQFVYGVGPNGLQGVPAKDVAGTVTNCVNPFCIGGETDGMIGSGVTLAFPLTRGDFYSRLSYNVTPDINVWTTINWAEVGTSNVPNPDAWRTGVNIPCDNAYLAATGIFGAGLNPAQTQAACLTDYPKATYPSGFQFGSDYQNLGPQTVYTLRDQRRIALGADGAFSLFGNDWTWDTYFEHGENNTHEHVNYITLKPNLAASIDSVVSASGQVVCRSTIAQAQGCIPFDPFGNVAPSQGQLDWFYGGAALGPGPFQQSHQKQDAFSVSVNGSPLSDWAGKVSIATGIDYRAETYYVYADAGGNGNVQVPGVPFYPCTDPLLDCVNGVNWYAGSFHDGKGTYHVTEGFVETGVPLIDTPNWGKADLDLAGRMESYSTAGQALTWKVGVTWDTPLEGVRLRMLQSRDVRAPNLSELFAAPTTANGTDQNPWTNHQDQVVNATFGNPNLKPEKSQNSQAGIVYQPGWLAGFNMSVDYYRIGLKGQVGTVTQQNEINYCFTGLTQYCSAIVTKPAGTPLTVTAAPVFAQVNSVSYNIASTVTDGFNIAADYQFGLDDWGVPGDFAFRNLATNVSKFITNSGLIGAIPVETAGTNDGAIPHWKILATQNYDASGKWSFNLTETWISDGVHNRSWIQCTSGCPLPTVNNPTINDNHVPAIWYLAVGGSYNLSDALQAYARVDNVMNKNAPPDGGNTQNPNEDGVNTQLYDDIGRMYHIGIRANF